VTDLARALDRARHHLRRPLARTPYVWDAAMLARSGKRRTLARRGTAIVIEGYLRSGNTFSVAAFAVANGTDLHVGRHLHGAPHILRAARLGLPTIVLIRQPRDAVLSYLIRRDTLSPDDAVLEYIDFYRTALRVRGAFVVGLFDEVVTDFGAVLERVNARFGTSFARYEPTAANAEAAFSIVEEMNRRECDGEVRETHVGRPSPERAERKAQLEDLLDVPRTTALLRVAEDCYQEYVSLAAAAAAGNQAQHDTR
jgi:hypothetical protein